VEMMQALTFANIKGGIANRDVFFVPAQCESQNVQVCSSLFIKKLTLYCSLTTPYSIVCLCQFEIKKETNTGGEMIPSQSSYYQWTTNKTIYM
jgi:hypothetical protein